jgi:hypothetical protein
MHFAEINPSTNEVLRVIVCDSKAWCEQNLGGTWVRTYYSTPGKNYAGQGYIYYSEKENFSTPQPYPSWTLDDNLKWQAPVPYPTDTNEPHTWDEATQSWSPFILQTH